VENYGPICEHCLVPIHLQLPDDWARWPFRVEHEWPYYCSILCVTGDACISGYPVANSSMTPLIRVLRQDSCLCDQQNIPGFNTFYNYPKLPSTQPVPISIDKCCHHCNARCTVDGAAVALGMQAYAVHVLVQTNHIFAQYTRASGRQDGPGDNYVNKILYFVHRQHTRTTRTRRRGWGGQVLNWRRWLVDIFRILFNCHFIRIQGG